MEGLHKNRSTEIEMSSRDNHSEFDLVIVTGDQLPGLVQFAAEELRRYVAQLFGIRVMVRETSGEWSGPVVVLDPAEARRAKSDLSDQGIILQGELTASGGRLLCSGGSAPATLWAAYELLDHLGVRFLLSGDIVPSEPRPFVIPRLDVVREPLFRLRAWRGMNVIAHSATMWGLAEYRRLIDQLAKLKFNLLYLVFRPGEPYFQFEFDGVRQESAVLDFGHRYPIDERTIGRELFGGQKEFTNPELYGCATEPLRRERAMKLVHDIIAYAHTRGVKVSITFCFPEFLDDHKQRLVELSRAAGFVPEGSGGGHLINYVQWKEGADPRFAPYVRIRNPVYLDLLEAYLRTWLSTYPEADYLQAWAMEFRAALPADADWALQQLNDRNKLPSGISMQGLREQVRKRAGADDQRAMMELEGDICALYAWDVLWNDRNVRALLPDDRSLLVMGGLCAEVNLLLPGVLGPRVECLVSLGYTAAAQAKRIEELKPLRQQGMPFHLLVSLEDDNIGILPQVTVSKLHRLVQGAKRAGSDGLFGRQWLVSKLEPQIDFLANAAWRDPWTPADTFHHHLETICGAEALPILLRAMEIGEQADDYAGQNGVGLTFLMPGLINYHWLFAQPPDKSLGVLQDYYRQLLSSLRDAEARSLPQGRGYLARYIEQSNFGIHWIDMVVRVKEASVLRAQAEAKASPLSPTVARTSDDPIGYGQLLRQCVSRLEQALDSSRLALEAWARSVVDRSDLGALAALNEFGHRTLESILHQQRMEADHWSFLMPAKDRGDGVGAIRFDKRKIVHIRGVDHPESISVGPQGEAYTTGTGGQVYRIHLDTNTVEQFASTAPRRMLGQAVDADGNLYCADTSGKVIRITPQGVESTYGVPARGSKFHTPNYPLFDRAGHLYLSDSGDWSEKPTGRMYKFPPGGGEAQLWFPEAVHTPNAIALDASESFLYFVQTFDPAIARIAINPDGSAGPYERVLEMPRHVPDGIAFDEVGCLWIACHRPDAIYRLDLKTKRLECFCEDWMGHKLRGPADVAFAGPNRDILLASSLDNLVVHRFDGVGVRGLKLNHPKS